MLLAWVGRVGEGEWERLGEPYVERIRRFVKLEVVRIRQEPGRSRDPGRARTVEGERFLALVRPRDWLVALDQHGEELSSEELALALAQWLGSGRVVMGIGSDLGLSPAVLARAQYVLSLSRLTLPHNLARVLLLEQLYRCLDLNAGGAYHRAGGGEKQVGYNPRAGRRR